MSALPKLDPVSPTDISVEEYLRTSYQPDCDYIDGEVKERNLGEKEHAVLQKLLILLFSLNEEAWDTVIYPELRVQVSPTRFRVPDLTVTRASEEWDHILRTPPLLVIEILSPEDTLPRLKQRVTDYLNLGVTHIWAIEPQTRTAYTADANGFHEPADGSATGTLRIAGTAIVCSLADLWASFDRATNRAPAPPPSQNT